MSADVRELVAVAQRLRQQSRFSEACATAQRALEIEPDNAVAWFNLGAALGALGRLDSAEAAYRRALECNPRYAEAWSNLGGLLGASGRAEEKLVAYHNATEANPNLAPVWSNLGNALCEARRYPEAETACRRAVELDSKFVAGWLNLGRVLHETKRPIEAKSACQRAVELAPQVPEAWAGLGNALMAMREFEAAIAAYQHAISLRPGSSEFHTNLGIALRRTGLDDQGAASLRTALELDPANDFASWNMGIALLERGELQEGWTRYEARWAAPDSPPLRFGLKGGPPFEGRALLWGEQGIGDQILYAPLAREVSKAGATVTLETDARLVGLFRRSFTGLTVLPQGDPPQADPSRFEHVLPLGSLGGFLRPSFDAFPKHRGYLAADTDRRERFRAMLSDTARGNWLIVGIAWRSSNPQLGNEKSAPLREWGELLSVPGVTFVSLQYGDVADERRDAERRFGKPIAALPGLDVFADLDGLAALHGACDLVITTSTVNAHFQGALGRPGWVLLPRRIGTLWYWFGDREESPWYPSLTLIRQSDDGDWSSVIQRAARKLRDEAARADNLRHDR
jgi:Flp pilus assembly protein TadD